ncbi:MAG: hypothetical protein HYZ49_06160 [Chloroflexi bacterium]|nr:hypothetical protein [Chloroflexota bacterium]
MSNEQLSTSEKPANSWRQRASQFLTGFIGWPTLNAVATIFLSAILTVLVPCVGFGCFGLTFILLGFLAVINIGILIFLAVKRRWWILAGIVTTFAASIAVIWLMAALQN